MLARESGASEATISRAMAGRAIRGLSALHVAQALRRRQPVPELLMLVSQPGNSEPAGAASGSYP